MILSLKSNIITLHKLAYAVMLALLSATAPASAQGTPAQGKVQVVASFSILADFVKHVAGERAVVTTLVAANTDAHAYSPKPEDAKALGQAQLVVMNGLGFEGFMPRLIKSSGTKAVIIEATNGIKPLEKPSQKESHGHEQRHEHGHEHGKADPHAWQSVEAVKTYITNIRDGLIKIDAQGASAYQMNAERYIAELSSLQNGIKTAIDALPPHNRTIITSHNAFQYFESEFGIKMEALQGVSTESAPSAKDMARIIRLVKEKKARAVFIENMTDPRMVERLKKETHAKLGGTLFSDALSDANGPASTYIKMMQYNMSELVAALR